jgi:hypothetical protein
MDLSKSLNNTIVGHCEWWCANMIVQCKRNGSTLTGSEGKKAMGEGSIGLDDLAARVAKHGLDRHDL